MSNGCNIWADAPQLSQAPLAILGVGHRECTGPAEARITVRLRKDRSFWPDTTLAAISRTDTDVQLTARYDCRGTGSQTVFTEIIVGTLAKYPKGAVAENGN